MSPGFGFGGGEGLFGVIFALFPVIFLGVIGFMIFAAVKGYQESKRRKAAIDERIVRAQGRPELVPCRRHRFRYGAVAALERAAGIALRRPGESCVEERLSVESERRRLVDPCLPQRLAILDVELGIARVGGDAVPPLWRGDAELGRLFEDRLAALAESVDHRLGHALDFEEHRASLPHLANPEPEFLEPAGEFAAVQGAGTHLVVVEMSRVEGPGLAVLHDGDVDGEGMGMELGI